MVGEPVDNVKSTSPAAPLTATSSAPSYAAHAPVSTTFASGVLNLNLSRPGPGTGSFDLTMTVPSWLRVVAELQRIAWVGID